MAKIDKKFFQQLKKDYSKSEGERRQIISQSNMILHDSKRVIFSLHRADIKIAEESLADIESRLSHLDKKFGHTRLMFEGSYKAGVEEYVEARLFHSYISEKSISKFPKLKIDFDCYLGGISDLTGEMVRLAINSAAKGRLDEVEKIKDAINDILAQLVEFDFTGYLRTKYDQARTNLRKIEQINYEIKIRK